MDKWLDRMGIAFFLGLGVMAWLKVLFSGNLLTLGLVAYNVLLAGLLAVRRRPARPAPCTEMVLGLAGALLPFVLVLARPTGPVNPLGLIVQGAGLMWMIAASAHLGVCFGVAPADRGLVCRGPYALVRHPLYLGELVFFAGYGIAHPSLLSWGVWLALTGVQLVRLRAEERAIAGYATYTQAVPWRLLPGIW